MKRIAVLISGELRFLEQCLPTMKFINDSVDVYVSTWDKVIIKNDLLGIDIQEDVTEERIRKLLPNASILIEPTECFTTKRYSDHMVHRWLAGWQMIRASGKHYAKIIVTRPDIYIDPKSSAKLQTLNTDDVLEIMWNTRDDVKADSMFAATFETLDRIFSNISTEDWQTNRQGDVHKWWADKVNTHAGVPLACLFQHAPMTFFRPSRSVEIRDIADVHIRHDDWRDAHIVNTSKKHGSFKVAVESWSHDITEEALLAYRSGRLTRKKGNKTLVIYCGEVRNFHAGALTLPRFGDADVAVVAWDTPAAHRFAKIVRADYVHLANFEQFKSELRKKSKLRDPVHYMFSHWARAGFLFASSDYERIVIIRPDVFIWAKYDLSEVPLEDNNLILNKMPADDQANDMWFMFGKSMWDKFRKLPDRLHQLSNELKVTDNIHKLLPLACTDIKLGNEEAADIVFAEVVQRDTFEFFLDDEYNRDFYTAILADSAAWWRKTNKSRYHIFARGL